MLSHICLSLPPSLGPVVTDSLITELESQGFSEKVEAGEIGAVQSFIWTKDDQIVSLSVTQDDEKWTLDFSSQATDLKNLIVRGIIRACTDLINCVADQLPSEPSSRLKALAVQLSKQPD